MRWRADRRRGLPWRGGAALGALLLALATGCAAHYQRTVVQDEGGITVKLRSIVDDGEVVARGFAHPAVISGVRLAHILSRIDLRMSSGDADEAGDRRPAVDTELIYAVGNALSAGLAEANPDQEVVVMALHKSRRLGIFTEERLTSLVAWVQDEDLVIHVSRSDDLLGKDELRDIKEPIPGRQVQAFKVVATQGVVPVAPQAVSVRWRDPVFREASRIRIGPTGRIERRTILMESPPQTSQEPPKAQEPPSDPRILRELAELEELRRAGEISEAVYHRRRQELLRAAEEASGATP